MENKKIVLIILIGLVVANVLAFSVVWDLKQAKVLEVIFFDVGQGDSIFIKSSAGHQILIDGGPDSSVLEKLAQEMPFFDRSIDMIILTHPDSDHLTGLIEVLKRYRIDYIVWTGVIKETEDFKQWQKLINEERAVIKIAEAGQRIKFSQAYLEILYPFNSLAGQQLKSTNNTSIVSQLVLRDNSFLFTGDIDKSIEQALITRNVFLDSDILKIAHHGSKTSSSQEFIEKVSPKTAIIFCGKNNKYNYPTQEVLDVLKNNNINILRTDQNGDIRFISNF